MKVVKKPGKSLKRVGATPTPASAIGTALGPSKNRFTQQTWNRSRVTELMSQIKDLKEKDRHLFR